MESRHITLLAVTAVLGTVGLVAVVTGTNPTGGAGGGSVGAGAAPTALALVQPDPSGAEAAVSTLALVAGDAGSAAGAADTGSPDTGAADPTAPDSAADTSVPDTSAPDTSAPDTSAPDTSTPDPYAGFSSVGAPAQPITPVGGASGAATSAVQQRLLDLGFWVGATDGKYGTTTKQAVMAFQKYSGLADLSGKVDQATADALNAATARAEARMMGDGVEVDKTRQLLFIVRGGVALWVLNASTGNGGPYDEADQNTPGKRATGIALTNEGRFHVNREHPEGWWDGDLGRIYRPKYFFHGLAVHGSGNVPNYPASHGCVRVSLAAMDFIWDQDLMPMKSRVWVHS